MKKVAVIFGGSSDEREVSMHTGLSVVDAIKDDYVVIPIEIEEDYKTLHTQLIDIDLVFIALHGDYGEDGRLQKYFNDYSITYTGSDYEASSIAMDKNQTKIIAQKNKIPVLEWIMLEKDTGYDLGKIKFPLIIKPNTGGSTIGLYYIEDLIDFNNKIQKVFMHYPSIMAEKYIKAREISVPIVDGQVLPSIEIHPKGFLYDYDSKYKSNGSKYTVPANIHHSISRKISDSALLIYKKIGCRHYARVDFLLDSKNNYYLLEINTLPGLTATSLLPKSAKSIGLSYRDLVIKIITLAMLDK